MTDPLKKIKIKKPSGSMTKQDKFTKMLKELKNKKSGARSMKSSGGPIQIAGFGKARKK
tara:strand:+ start:223 stop:399 length:177 start_codon:yes stop_codon:yes gene_type:complete